MAFAVTLLALALIFLGLSFVVLNGSGARADSAEYALIIDAGSSGSRIHLYKWLPEDDDLILDITKMPLDGDCDNVDGGLSTFGGDDYTDELPTTVRESLTSLITCAQLGLTDRVANFQKVPLHLRATAGMRMLRVEDKQRYYKIMEDVLAYLRSTPFHFGGARVIKGQEEALYAWIAANWYDSLAKAGEKPTKGILELGGASAQIAFVPNGSNDSKPEGTEVVRIAGREYQVYARGYDGVGKNEIIINFKETESCYPNDYITTAGVWGVGSYSECKNQIETRFEATKSNVFEKLRDADLPDHGGKEFLALSNFYYTLDFLGLNGTLNYDDFEVAGTEYCRKEWNDIRTEYKKTPEKFLSGYCFVAAYIPILLTEFLGEKSIEGGVMLRPEADVDWTLGALICSLYDCRFGS